MVFPLVLEIQNELLPPALLPQPSIQRYQLRCSQVVFVYGSRGFKCFVFVTAGLVLLFSQSVVNSRCLSGLGRGTVVTALRRPARVPCQSQRTYEYQVAGTLKPSSF